MRVLPLRLPTWQFWIGLPFLGAGLLLLTGCSGARFKVGVETETGTFDPSFLSGLPEMVEQAGEALGFPWLKIGGGILATLIGGAGVTKGLVNSYDKKPFVGSSGVQVSEAELVDAAVAARKANPVGAEKPVA